MSNKLMTSLVEYVSTMLYSSKSESSHQMAASLATAHARKSTSSGSVSPIASGYVIIVADIEKGQRVRINVALM
jgi:protein involved in ribonucleotide reduction